MRAPLRRKPTTRGVPKRRPLNLRTLQMMVQSLVVRRADIDPPSVGSRTGFQMPDEGDPVSTEEAGSERGWLTRIILGHKSAVSVSKRPGRG